MFEIIFKDEKTRARLGRMRLAHGIVETPVFMPVGTKAAVKALSVNELEEIGIQIILSNTYHLNFRPAVPVIKKNRGLHNFMNWQKPILTDSGGFQVFSLSDHVKITDDGVKFRYVLDGKLDFFTPQKVIEIQRSLGSDIIMVLDQPVAYPVEKSLAVNALRRTTKWAAISRQQRINDGQKMFGIMQGSTYKNLRKRSAVELIEIGFDGYAIGGLSVGEPREVLFEVLAYSTDLLPFEKPRYLMGVGDPLSLVRGIKMGVDMFDSVLPTRIARNGTVFTSKGKLNLKNAVFKLDTKPLDDRCNCAACKSYSRSYLRHLYLGGEILAHRLLSCHNLFYLTNLVEKVKLFIREGKIKDIEKEMEQIYG